MKTTATSTNRMIGDYWVVNEIVSTGGGAEVTAIQTIGFDDYGYDAFPAVFWDMFAEDGADLDRVEGWCKIWEDTLVEDKRAVEAVQANVFEGTFRANRYMKAREPVPLHINDWIWSACRAELSAGL